MAPGLRPVSPPEPDYITKVKRMWKERKHWVKLAVKNFGPVLRADMEVRPLTIFIGRNDTGKSYMATLLYALMRGLMGGPRDTGALGNKADKIAEEKGLEILVKREDAIVINEHALRKLIEEVFGDQLDLAAEEVINRDVILNELRRCFGCSFEDLVTHGKGLCEVLLDISPLSHLELNIDNVNKRVYFSLPVRISVIREDIIADLVKNKFPLKLPEAGIEEAQELPEEFRYLSPEEIKAVRKAFQKLGLITIGHLFEVFHKPSNIIWSVLFKLEKYILPPRASHASARRLGISSPLPSIFPIHYLPASRSGILHGHRAVASTVVAAASIAPIIGLEVRGLPGPINDFLVELMHLPDIVKEHPHHKLREAIELLEHELLEGTIRLGRVGPTFEILYEREISVPVSRASSMASELAPLVLWVKHIVKPGHRLIMEEPEAHLHPAAQRLMARVLARLVNAGVGLIITTHSDYLLAQLSHLIQLSSLPPEKIKEFGYESQDVLRPEQVAVYLFKPTPGGTVVERLEITEEGIPEEEFAKIAEELCEESARIYYVKEGGGIRS